MPQEQTVPSLKMSAITEGELRTLLGHIIVVLNANVSVFSGCGPNASGTTTASLLASLQEQYPADGWTLEFLQDILDLGAMRGVVKQFPLGTWFINAFMRRVNTANNVYASLSDYIADPLPTCKCGPSTVL